jgi:photosystem II stability/assembly factor-like uncharacterized protein
MKKYSFILLVLYLFTFDVRAQWYPQNSGTTSILRDVSFSDVNNGIAVGGSLLKTTNGGDNWIEISFGSYPIMGVSFFDDSNAIVITSGYNPGAFFYIFRTSNGGTTWSNQLNGPMNVLNEISFRDINNGIVVGSTVFITTDGGINWNYSVNSPVIFFNGVSYTSPDHIIAVGVGNIYLSTDGGINWTQSSGTFQTLAVDCINSSIGFAVGFIGTILKTTDGGLTWKLQNSGTTNTLYDVSFVDVNNGFAVGESGTILRTTDGGIKWTQQESGTVNTLLGISMIDTNICTIVGDNGTILRTTNGGTPVELIGFTASIKDDNVNLRWITASEINNSGFEIERSHTSTSLSMTKWEKIGFIEGKGTTTEKQFYSFIDKNLAPGKYQYRLKQIDFDGSFEYSNIVEVEVGIPDEFSLAQNYPNPFNPSTKIKYTVPQTPNPFGKGQGVRLIVYDVLGNEIAALVNEEKEPGVYEVEFDGNNLSSGIYIYQLKAGSFVSSKKMTVVK